MGIEVDLVLRQNPVGCVSLLGDLLKRHLGDSLLQDEGLPVCGKLGLLILDVLELLSIPRLGLIGALQEFLPGSLNKLFLEPKFFPTPAEAPLGGVKSILHVPQKEVVLSVIILVTLLVGPAGRMDDELFNHLIGRGCCDT